MRFEHCHKLLKVISLHVSCGENCLQTASLKQMQSLWNTLWSYLRPQRPCFSLKKTKKLSNITVEWLYVLLTHCRQITAGEADWIWASAAKKPPSWRRALWETRGRWLIPLIRLLCCIMAFTLKEVAIACIRRLDEVKHMERFRGNSPQATCENLPLLPFVAYLHLTIISGVRHRRKISK